MTALTTTKEELQRRYEEFRRADLSLDMTRGKPCAEQLDLSNGILSLPGEDAYTNSAGVDCRNYGGLDGIPEVKKLFGDILGIEPEGVIIGGNSSLTLMYEALVRALLFGVPGGDGPWKDSSALKFLCPSPGFDRHFSMTEHLGFELISIGMNDDGPDMDQVEALASSDPSVKGIWCVPKYSNPTGVVYSNEVVERLSTMRTAAPDFRVIWDNAYAEHSLRGETDSIRNIMDVCRDNGTEDRILMFASTSKITYAGAGVSAIAGSQVNVADIKSHLTKQTIGPDKLNQLRHVRFLGDIHVLREHMRQHARILKPKFDLVDEILQRELGGIPSVEWTKPRGGYFVSLDVPDGCASKSVALAGEAGVKYTPAGATFPYGRDPRDRNIRIAPTFLPLEDIEPALEVLAVSIQLAAIDGN